MRHLSAIVLFTLLCTPLAVQAEEARANMLTVHGEAVTKVAPDQATLPVTVREENTNLKAAKEKHDEKLRKLLHLAEDMGIAKDKIQTGYTSTNPQYTYVSNNAPHLRGYEVQTMILFTLTDISKLGTFTNNVVDSGIDTVGNVSYSLQDEDKVKDDTLMKAYGHAYTKASRLAATAKVVLGKPLDIQEGGEVNVYTPHPMFMGAALAQKSNSLSAPAPELPEGLIEVRQSVTVTYAIQ